MSKPAEDVATPACSAEQRARRDIREVRSRWRTRQVLDAAIRLMNADGFSGVSMQALAREASVSVGLIYKYFGGREDVVVAVVLDLVHEVRQAVLARMTEAGDDPVEQLAAGFGAYCTVMDEHRHAGLLTYRQSGELGPPARHRLKAAELTTTAPLHEAAEQAARDGLLVENVDLELLVFDLMILAQGWALKYWHLREDYDVGRYIGVQAAAMLRSVLRPQGHERYRHLLDPPSLRA